MTARLCSSARLRTSGSECASEPNLYETAPSPGGRRVVLERVRVHRVEADADGRRRGRGVQPDRRGRPTARAGSRCGSRRSARCSAAMSSSFSSVVRGSPPIGKRPKRVPPVPTAHDGAATENRATSSITASTSTPLRSARRSRVVSRSRSCADTSAASIVDDLLRGDAASVIGRPCSPCQRRNAAATPPSTGTRRPVVRESAPSVSAHDRVGDVVWQDLRRRAACVSA